MNITCKYCDWYHEEHCVNGDSEYCTYPVEEDYSCEWWEEQNE
ncbi:MAG TPA: hypothetical protein VFD00_12280 [Thermoclostridium sp.]|nr:hypothetical protein [Thermoclostridium sp.]